MILDGIHRALVDSFKIPDSDRNQLIYEHENSHFERSTGKSGSLVIIEITAFKGRSKEAKRLLFRKISENLKSAPGIDPGDILIVIKEPELVNWGIRGKCADEIDLGFEVKV